MPKESKIQCVTVEHLSFDQLQRRRLANEKLSVCTKCVIVAKADQGDHCVKCGRLNQPLDDDLLDQLFPWGSCVECDYDFLWKDASKTLQPAEFLCPRCGKPC